MKSGPGFSFEKANVGSPLIVPPDCPADSASSIRVRQSVARIALLLMVEMRRIDTPPLDCQEEGKIPFAFLSNR
jgi:hypothetical protein